MSPNVSIVLLARANSPARSRPFQENSWSALLRRAWRRQDAIFVACLEGARRPVVAELRATAIVTVYEVPDAARLEDFGDHPARGVYLQSSRDLSGCLDQVDVLLRTLDPTHVVTLVADEWPTDAFPFLARAREDGIKFRVETAAGEVVPLRHPAARELEVLRLVAAGHATPATILEAYRARVGPRVDAPVVASALEALAREGYVVQAAGKYVMAAAGSQFLEAREDGPARLPQGWTTISEQVRARVYGPEIAGRAAALLHEIHQRGCPVEDEMDSISVFCVAARLAGVPLKVQDVACLVDREVRGVDCQRFFERFFRAYLRGRSRQSLEGHVRRAGFVLNLSPAACRLALEICHDLPPSVKLPMPRGVVLVFAAAIILGIRVNVENAFPGFKPEAAKAARSIARFARARGRFTA